MPDVGLYTALAGINAQTVGLDTASADISNVNTPGYVRQQVELSPEANGGVIVSGIGQVVDTLRAANAMTADSSAAAAVSYQGLMSGLESIFPEPGSNGLQSQLSSFWSSWDDVANDPTQMANRTQVINYAGNLVMSLNQASNQLTALSQSAAANGSSLTGEVNGLLSQIASLNGAVVAAGPAGAGNALVDQRNQLISQLSQDIGVTVRAEPNGAADVLLGGLTLVQGKVADTLSFDTSGPTAQLISAHTGTAVPVVSGKIGGVLQALNGAIPTYRARLDSVAATLASTVNAQQAAGQTSTGASGSPLFVAGTGSTVTAADIAVNPAVQADPTLLAAAGAGAGSLDGTNAQAMAELASSATGPDQIYQVLIGNLGSDVSAANSVAQTQSQFSQQADAANQAVSGVNTDEEMVRIMSYQHAYEASAKVLNTIDATLQSLLAAT